MRRLSHFHGVLIVIASGVIFSFGPLTLRATTEATDWQFLAYRSGSAGLVASLWLVLRRRRSVISVLRAADPRTWLAGVLLGGTMVCFVLALTRITVAPVALMQTAAPMVAAGAGWVLLAERVRPAAWAAIGLGAVGVAVMLGGNLGSVNTAGLALASLTPVGLGLYSVLLRSAPTGDLLVPIVVAGVLSGGAGAVMSLAGPGLGLPAGDALMGFIAGGVLIGLGLPLFNYGHRLVPAAEIELLLLTEVVLAPLWVWIWPGETPGAATLAGGALLLASVAGLALTAERLEPARRPTRRARPPRRRYSR